MNPTLGCVDRSLDMKKFGVEDCLRMPPPFPLAMRLVILVILVGYQASWIDLRKIGWWK